MIKMRMFILSLLFLSSVAFAQPYYTVNIGGWPMSCTAHNGQPVAIYIDPSVNQYIGLAQTNGYPTIRLGPGFFNNVPGFIGRFWFAHECAHHLVGSNESHADCVAIRQLRDLGYIANVQQVEALLRQIYQMPGSPTHLPGPSRAQNVLNCFNS